MAKSEVYLRVMNKGLVAAMKELKLHREGEMRRKILDFQEILAKHPDAVLGDADICPLTHKFTDGIYVREIFIPKGTYIVGKIHKHEHPNFLMRGTVEVVTEGGGLETLTGPMSIISPAGTKRALKALTDLVWITVHHNPTNTQNLEELEQIVIAPSYEAYDKFISKQRSFLNRILSKVKTKLLQL